MPTQAYNSLIMSTNNYNSAGHKILISRKRKGLTQSQLTLALNDLLSGNQIVERSMVSRWEADKHFPTAERKLALEKILGIQLGEAPLRRDHFAAYLSSRDEVYQAILDGFKGTSEFWMINRTAERSSIPSNAVLVKELFEELRNDKDCVVSELFFIHEEADMRTLIKRISAEYPSYLARAVLSPSPVIPFFYSPADKFGVLLSDIGADSLHYGIELHGVLTRFTEQLYRDLWADAIPVYTAGGVSNKNLKLIRQRLKDSEHVKQLHI